MPHNANSVGLRQANNQQLARKDVVGQPPRVTDSSKPFVDIAARLRWHRALVDLNQDAYAERINCKRSQLSNWEAGTARISLDAALALRKRYGLSLDFIYEGIADALPMTLRNAFFDSPAVSASR